MSSLRRRMIEDMTIRNLSPKTQQGYIRTIKNFTAFLRRSPDTATFEDVRRFQLHLVRSGVGVGTLNSAVSALRFFFKVTLGRGDIRMLWCLRFIGIGIGEFDGINRKYRQREQLAGAGDVLDTLAAGDVPMLRRPHDHHRD